MSELQCRVVSFLESEDSKIYHFIEESAKNAWRYIIGTDVFLEDTDIAIEDANLSQITEMRRLASSLAPQALDAVPFLLKNKTAMGDWNYSSTLYYPYQIDSISVSGITQFTEDIKNLLQQYMDSDTGHQSERFKDIIDKLNDPSYMARLKRRCVKFKGIDVGYSSPKDILHMYTPHPVCFSDTQVTEMTSILNEFAKAKTSDYDGKKTIDLTESSFKQIETTLRSAFRLAETELAVMEKVFSDDKSAIKARDRIFFPIKVKYMELRKFLIGVCMQYIGGWVSDVQTILKAKNDFSKSISSDECLENVKEEYESAGRDIDECVITECDFIVDGAKRVLDDAKVDGNIEFADEYDKRSYDLLVDLLRHYSDNLSSAMSFTKESMDAGLITRRFELNYPDFWDALNGNTISDNFLSSVGYGLPYICSDLRAMIHTLPKLRDLFIEIGTKVNKFTEIADRFDNEGLVKTLRFVSTGLEDANHALANKYIQRLNNIANHLHPTVTITSSLPVDDNDYFLDALVANYDAVTESHEDNMEEINSMYRSIYLNSVTPDIFMEADDNQNQNQDNNNNQNSDQNNNQNNNSLKPKVKDTSGDQNNGDQNNNNKSVGNIIDRIVKFIGGIIDKLKGFFDKNAAKKKNLKFLDDYGEYLTNRSYSNVGIDILPYLDINYIDTMNKIIDKGANLTETQVRSMNEDAIYNTLLSDTSYKKIKGDDKNARIQQALKVGTANLALVDVRNGALKAEIPKMINFVKNYYNNIQSGLTNVQNSIKTKLTKLNAMTGSSSDGDRTVENVKLVPTIINTVIGACINISRTRTNDYMTILNGLVPEEEKQKRKNAQNNNNNQNTEENQNNG